jgi:putative ABC transport system permease protein
MFRTSLHNLLSHKLRLALTTLAIVLGVTFVAGTLVLTNTISNYSKGLIGGLDKGVAVQVQGSVNPLPASVLGRVQAVPGVADAVGELNRSGIALLVNGTVIGGSLEAGALGGNWISDPGLSPYRLTAGSAPVASNDVVIDAESATFAHLRVGDVVQVAFTASAAQTFRISGIATYGSETSEGGKAFALFMLPTAEQLLQAGTYDAIAASAQASVTDLQLRDRIASALAGSAVQVQTGAAATAQSQQTAATTINQSLGTPLLVFAFISVFVGTFLIVNTFSILVAQRTRELALLRALGATRRQIFVQVITEAALTGLLASLIGFVLGLAVAGALLHLVASAVPLSIPLSALITSVLVGTLVTVIAAALPARRATRIAPVAALREAPPEMQSLSRKRIVAGLVLLVGGVAALVLSLLGASASTTPNLQVLGLSVLVVFLAMALLAPVVVRPIAGVLALPARLRGAPGRLAGENAQRNPRRTAMTAAALMVGLALVTGVAVLTDSLKASVDQAIDGNIRAQLVVFDKGGGSNFTGQVAMTLRGDPAIAEVAEIQGSSVQVGDISTNVDGIAPSSIGPDLVFPMVSGGSASLATLQTGLVDSTTAKTLKLHVGSTVTLTYPNGAAVPIHVGGIYAPDAVLSGFYVSAATFAPHVTPLLDSVVLANPAAGTSLAAADTSLLQDLRGYPVLTGYTAAQYLNYESSQLDTFLNLIYVLLGLAIVIAVVGIVNTLALSVLERTRELGLLRAIGMTRSQVREMVAWESVIIALLGAALGLCVGAGLGIAMASSLHADGITATAVPAGNLLLYAAAAACFGLLAAIFPAIRASRVNVLRAVTTE